MYDSAQRISSQLVRDRLKLKNLEARKVLSDKFSQINQTLFNKAFDVKNLRAHSSKLIGAGIGATALASSLALSPVDVQKHIPQTSDVVHRLKTESKLAPVISPQKVLIDSLKALLPEKVRPLSRDEEKKLEVLFKDVVGVSAKGTLEGEHLNQTYGLIGAEQHLRRYPGDTMATHPKVLEDDEGMAPGLGAWGYFAPSKEKLTPDLVETEKWYAVVQTLYLPDWNTRTKYLRDWYKHRKVLIVNTTNGNAVVAAIADSGPAAWTGKVFGGSPEVMNHLGGPRYKKGPVVLFFVDDPQNKVPLGPIEYNKINLPQWAFHEI